MFLIHQKLLFKSTYARQLRTFYRLKHVWRSQDVRQSFINLFKEHYDHVVVPSASVIPKKGEGTYFTNAGMNQFKPLFLGAIPPGSVMADYRRVVNSQKCIRVGGKHNDLDDVGHDLSHHTFFEMLGNWSFGDYFKKEACTMAYELITDVYKIPTERLYFTYFNGDSHLNLPPDLESKTIWLELGIPESHILPFGMRDNFWDMGDIGPCGPCSEIHYDHIGKGGRASLVNTGSPDVVEIWNLVFMQFDRQSDRTLRPLTCHHVDTGMGLERMCAVLRGCNSNYDTDLFSPLFHTIHKISKSPVYSGHVGSEDTSGLDTAYRILADHSRMFSIAIADGLLPDRDGLGHKLRQIIHRSIQQSTDVFHCDKSLLLALVDDVTDSLGDTYPEIVNNNKKIKDVISMTEDAYLLNKEKGTKAFYKMLKQHGDIKHLTGPMIYELVDGRFGFAVSIDLILDLARDIRLTVDLKGYEQIQHNKQNVSEGRHDLRSHDLLLRSEIVEKLTCDGVKTDDSFKYCYSIHDERYVFESPADIVIKSIVYDGNLIDQLQQDQTGYIILDKTCCYGEAGGQSSDEGQIFTKTGRGDIIDVKLYKGFVLHQVKVNKGFIETEVTANIVLNQDKRRGCMSNHTATHLLNAALRKVLDDPHQKGSDIQSHKFNFDFLSLGSVNVDEIREIEKIVKHSIQDGCSVERHIMSLADALNIPGIVALQNEVYPETVSVIQIGEIFSSELCGGTHVYNTRDIEEFCIIKLSGVSQGTKRVTCVTGPPATQAKRNKDMLIYKYNQLDDQVKSVLESETWLQQLKDIYKILHLELLPKIDRDEYQVKTDIIQTTIRTELNKQRVTKLSQILKDVSSEEQAKPLNIVYNIPTPDVKLIIKTMKAVSIMKPLILIAEGDKKTTMFILLPQVCVSEDFIQRLKSCVLNAKISKNTSLKDKELYSLDFQSLLSTQELSEVENNLMNLFENS